MMTMLRSTWTGWYYRERLITSSIPASVGIQKRKLRLIFWIPCLHARVPARRLFEAMGGGRFGTQACQARNGKTRC
ncbi:MAG: hypothetical protein HY663_03840 [Chloroflexi bacterium]|nr:hypothetical protein [Chloroflexota bacterium]